jgi:8-oxo-dGTP pyrophosphatase MutT (NUDIX family)
VTVTFDLAGPPVAPRDAATVVLLRDAPEGLLLFFVRRSAEARFMGGAYVFPGGRVDPGDAHPDTPCDLSPEEAARRLGEPDGPSARALHVAALRECLEESGVLLGDPAPAPEDLAALRQTLGVRGAPRIGALLGPHGVTLRTSALVPFARWITPAVETRRFDARFFLARCPAGLGQGASHDGEETVASAWLSAREALAHAERRALVLAPPTWRTLEVLALARTAEEALALAPQVPLDPVEPVVVPLADTLVVLLPEDHLHPSHLSLQPRYLRGAWPAGALPATRFTYDNGCWMPGRASP